MVVIATGDAKLLVVLSVKLAKVCVAPAVIATVSVATLVALIVTTAVLDSRPACADDMVDKAARANIAFRNWRTELMRSSAGWRSVDMTVVSGRAADCEQLGFCRADEYPVPLSPSLTVYEYWTVHVEWCVLASADR